MLRNDAASIISNGWPRSVVVVGSYGDNCSSRSVSRRQCLSGLARPMPLSSTQMLLSVFVLLSSRPSETPCRKKVVPSLTDSPLLAVPDAPPPANSRPLGAPTRTSTSSTPAEVHVSMVAPHVPPGPGVTGSGRAP